MMSGFADTQIKALKGKLDAAHVSTREVQGRELSFVEGWFTIAEANRIFGFDGWDRETLELTCVWQGKAGGTPTCSYLARVRVTVRAGEHRVVREGCGYGTGTGATPGEAHEKALKEAETDAMKRALVTFGNRFGLALYDREQRGVSKPKDAPRPDEQWPVHSPQRRMTVCNTAREVYSELRKELATLRTVPEVQDLWRLNETTLRTIRERHRELVDRAGAHYTAVFARLCRERVRALDAEQDRTAPASGSNDGPPARLPPAAVGTSLAGGDSHNTGGNDDAPPSPAGHVDKSRLAIATPRRIRDREHLRFVAAQPCLVCGRLPAHAHHLAFVQPRARGLKTSDEWTVPLCALHHRELHDRGDERSFWVGRAIDAEIAALALWSRSRGTDRAGDSDDASSGLERPSPAPMEGEPAPGHLEGDDEQPDRATGVDTSAYVIGPPARPNDTSIV